MMRTEISKLCKSVEDCKKAWACGETGTDYLGIDEGPCSFFKNGWYEKALEIKEKYEGLMVSEG